MSIYTTADQVSDEINSRMLAITIANGCETDIGLKVMRGRRTIPGEDEPPCVIILEGNDDIKDRAGSTPAVLVSQAYVLDGFDKCDPDHPNDKAHAMIRDIKRALFRDGGSFCRKVSKVTYLGRDIGPRPDGVALVQCRVMIVVDYVEDLANP